MSDDLYRELTPLPDAVAAFTGWIAYLDLEFTRHLNPELRSEIVRDELHQLYMGHAYAGKLNSTMVTEQGLTVLQFTLDPRNATLEPEYYADIDVEKYAVIKPLIWFWQMFDRSPVGLNQWLGFRFRAMLGRHIFRHMGQNVTFFQGVEFTFGYNLTIADNCILHKNVLLDDRNELLIPEGSSVSDSTRVSSPTYSAGIVPNGTGQALAD